MSAHTHRQVIRQEDDKEDKKNLNIQGPYDRRVTWNIQNKSSNY